MIELGFKPEEFERLFAISNECYVGDERPNIKEFRTMTGHDVFVARKQAPYGHPECGRIIIIGFAVVASMNSNHPYLWSLAVTKEFQGCGVGGNLLREVIKRYTLSKPEISLHVHPDNPAQKLYFDYGFRVEGIARNWYKNRNGLFMRRPLP